MWGNYNMQKNICKDKGGHLSSSSFLFLDKAKSRPPLQPFLQRTLVGPVVFWPDRSSSGWTSWVDKSSVLSLVVWCKIHLHILKKVFFFFGCYFWFLIFDATVLQCLSLSEWVSAHSVILAGDCWMEPGIMSVRFFGDFRLSKLSRALSSVFQPPFNRGVRDHCDKNWRQIVQRHNIWKNNIT